MSKIVVLIVGLVVATLCAATLSAAPLSAAATPCAATTASACPVVESQRETRALSSFSRIEVDGAAEVLLRQGKTEGVTIEASTDILPRIRTRVRDRTLYIDVSLERRWSDWTHWFHSQPTPRITVDFVRLDRVESGGVIKLMADGLVADELHFDFAGASTIRIRNLRANLMTLDGSGATKVELSGKVGTQAVDLSGAGSYAAFDLESDRAEVHVSGAGKAYVNAKTALSVEISGAGLVEYLGNPKVDKDISGVGKVRRREPD